ncbi:MAG: hypothetical protein ACR5K4_03460 [Sodalis sp. (in: enterobacteria)]
MYRSGLELLSVAQNLLLQFGHCSDGGVAAQTFNIQMSTYDVGRLCGACTGRNIYAITGTAR